jgi:superfamily II DNA or RNA helicase
MGEFNTILEELNYNIERGFKKLRIVATTGFGKGLILHMFGRHTEISKKSNILVYYANTIFNTKQLAKVHYDKYEYGGKLQNDNKKIIVCTDITKVKTRDNKYIEVYAASDNTGRLKQIIKHALLNDDRYTFYVNKASAYAFNKIINEIIDDTNYTKLILVGIDEIQDFTGRIDKTEITGAVTNPIKNSIQMGVTATEERRDDSEKNRKDIVKNNDIEYFGKLIYEIFPDDAMALKRHSPVDFVTLVLSKGNDELTNSLLKNKEIALKLGRKSESVRIRLLHNLVGIVKGINDYKKSKILDVCSYRGDVSKILECLEILQKNNIISSDFIFINGLIENRTESIDKFNHKNTKKAIVVGTSWLCVGMDAPKCDMVISVYDFGKKRFARQFVGRGTRFDGNKRCLVMVPVLSSEWKIPTLILVKEDFEKNQNSHSNTLSKVDIKTPYSGAKKPKGVTHQTVIATQCEPLDELKWNEYNLAVECNELGSFDFKKITKKYLLNGLNTYPNLEHLIKYDWNTFRRIERHQEIYDIDEILSIFPDYNSIPSDKDLFSKDIQNKSDKISKNRNLKRVYLVKLNQINKKIYEKNIN